MIPRKFTCWLTINRACNLRCYWCYAKDLKFSSSENMSAEVLETSVSFLKGLPLNTIILIGGEPTIHPNFLDIVAAVYQAGFKTFLVTNSLEFRDRKYLEETLKAGISGITTSLKATSEEQYSKFTGRRAFQEVMQAIENINSTGIYHKISVTVCNDLFSNFEDVVKIINEKGANTFSIDMERPILINGNTICSDIEPKEVAKQFVTLYPTLLSCKTNLTIKISLPFCLFPQGFIDKLVKNNHLISACQIFDGSGIIIDPKGKLLPCNHFCDYPLGIIGSDFLSGEEYFEFRKRPDVVDFYKTMSNYPHENCKGCKDWKHCGAGCRLYWLHMRADKLLGDNIRKEVKNDERSRVTASVV